MIHLINLEINFRIIDGDYYLKDDNISVCLIYSRL